MPFKRAAGEVFNILPDRMNLFLRYMSGVGTEGLKLDDSTLRSIRQATEQPDKIVDYVDPKEAARDMFLLRPETEARFAEIVARSQTDERKHENRALGLPDITPLDQAAAESLRKSQAVRSGDFDSVFPGGLRKEPIQRTTFKAGPGVPTSVAVNPYLFGTVSQSSRSQAGSAVSGGSARSGLSQTSRSGGGPQSAMGRLSDRTGTEWFDLASSNASAYQSRGSARSGSNTSVSESWQVVHSHGGRESGSRSRSRGEDGTSDVANLRSVDKADNYGPANMCIVEQLFT